MTRHDRLLADAVLKRFGNAVSPAAVELLFELGLADRRACERLAIRDEVEQLVRRGVRRIDSLEAVARKYSCSYEKVRNYFYEKH